MSQAAAVPFRRPPRQLPDLLQELIRRNPQFVRAIQTLAVMEVDRLNQADRDRLRAAYQPRLRE